MQIILKIAKYGIICKEKWLKGKRRRISSWINHFKSWTAMVGLVKRFLTSQAGVCWQALSAVTEPICKWGKSQGTVHKIIHIMAKDEFYNIDRWLNCWLWFNLTLKRDFDDLNESITNIQQSRSRNHISFHLPLSYIWRFTRSPNFLFCSNIQLLLHQVSLSSAEARRFGPSIWAASMGRSVMQDWVRSVSLSQLILLGCCCCMWTLNFRNNIGFHTGSTNPNNQVEQRRLKLILLRVIRKQSNKHIFIEWKQINKLHRQMNN